MTTCFLPYFLLILVMMDEHYAMWFFYFFLIPLLDVMFYLDPPLKNTLHPLWYQFWFPSVLVSLSYSSSSFSNILSFGIFYNTLWNLADNLKPFSHSLDLFLQRICYSFLGVHPSIFSVIFLFFLISINKVGIHVGSLLVGYGLHLYFQWLKTFPFSDNISLDYYGWMDHVLFNFYPQPFPTTPLWCFFYKLV